MPTAKPRIASPRGVPYTLTGEHFYKFFQCPHWIWYDVYGDKQKMGKTPALLDMIHQDGLKHERHVVQERHKDRKFEEIKPESYRDLDEAFVATLELMKKGVNIYHGVLMDAHWVGMPDLLEARPVEKGMTSVFGEHYYVVYDGKSGSELKEEYKFQLAFYSVILERIQGILPREAYMINSMGEERSFVVDDFLDLFHLTRERIEEILDGQKPAPFLKSGCKKSPWYALCVEDTKGCDDVSLIHRLSQSDQRRLYDLGIHTVKDLATADLEDLRGKLEDWQFDKVLRFHNQANVLVSGEPMILKKSEFPSVKTEIYFDIESDPTEEIDYLLGVLIKSGFKTEYKSFLAKDKKDEERIWREFLDFLEELEDFVIYHYSQFEPQVFHRFGQQYGISLELDHKFKDHTIDLFKTTTEAVVLPLYFYSLKDVAKYLGFAWESTNAGGAESVVWYNEWLALRDGHDAPAGAKKILGKILQYNQDDCQATLFVKEWLEKQKPKTSREKLD